MVPSIKLSSGYVSQVYYYRENCLDQISSYIIPGDARRRIRYLEGPP